MKWQTDTFILTVSVSFLLYVSQSARIVECFIQAVAIVTVIFLLVYPVNHIYT